ncbi:hypothetical protein DOQ08_00429 [Marinobacter litoralis]|uniref:Cupin domain protein n=1 Tax=Marinobacter litoralis TaxID=187981 RepID=A0A3M2RKA0_9GAMM|nr:hypothetical protein [Marinobacter litoralis]RMJ05757.1 hypothetical protein DOQ08_00429 [Marinobacter litoralis]
MSLRTHSRLLLLGMLVSMTGVVTAEEEPHQAAHVTSPDFYTVLKENDQVLVLKMVLGPGESDAMHRHHNETVYFQKGGQLSIESLNGDTLEAKVPDGHVMWHQAWPHRVTNVGDDSVIAIIVEDKP